MSALVIHLLSIAVLAVLVEAACRLGRFRPAVCHALWLVVLVKLIVPPVVSWPIDAELLGRLSWERMAAKPSSGPLPGESVAVVERAAGEATGTLRPGEEFAVLIPHATWEPLSWVVTLGCIWTGGGLLMALRTVREVRRARARLSKSLPVPDWMRSRIDDAAVTLGVAAPRAVVTQESGAVYVQLWAQPVLVISAETLTHVAPEQWDAILTHELAHLKRRDHWVAWLMLAAGVVWWWNPILWWVRKRVHLFSEMACDAWVVNVHPGARKQYAETMVRIMALLSRQEAPAPAMGLAAWSVASQEKRLWMIMKAKDTCTVPMGVVLGVSAIAVLVAPSWVAPGAEEVAGSAAAPAAASVSEGVDAIAPENKGWTMILAPSDDLKQAIEKSVSIEFDDIHIKSALEYLQDTFEVNFVLDQRVVRPEPPEGGLSVPGAGAPVAVAATNAEGPLGGRPYTTDGVVTYIKLLDTPLKDVLTALLKPLGLTFQIRGHAVWVSTPAQFSSDQEVSPPSALFSDGAILTRLQSSVDIEFEGIHLQDIVQFMQEAFATNIVLDGQVIMPEGKDWNSPPLGSPGYATDGAVRYIHLRGLPLGEALYHITRLLNLTYVITEDYVYISTAERAAEFTKSDR